MAEFCYLSLGAGVQSTALLVMSARGLHGCPRANIAVFADTGDEPAWVYEHLARLEAWSPIPIHRVQRGHLSYDLMVKQRNGRRYASIPLYTASPDGGREGMLRRQCTSEYKIEPIEKFVREYLGYRPRMRVRHRVTALMGISIDEALRMKPARTPWVTSLYPLVGARLTRRACQEIIRREGLPEPRKSSCVFCPYHSDSFWKDLKANHPIEWAKAVEVDEQIRDMTMRGQRQPGYLHRSCRPLAEVDFDPHRDQVDLFLNECEGMCGV